MAAPADPTSLLRPVLAAGGLCLRALGLWLDPTDTAPAAFVSHAHAAAAAAGCGRVIASAETLVLARAMGASLEGARAIGWNESIELGIDEAAGGGTARLSIAPAGHLLGAAQLVVDHPAGRLVYTGDWSAEGDATAPAGAVVPSDELIVTSAFALPIFRFEPRVRTLAAIVAWCEARLAAGERPVVLAPADVRRTAAQGGSDPASGGGGRTGRTRRGKTVVAYASPWALLDAAMEQKRADAGFVLADQADHRALMALVRATGARRVHTTRGDARVFAHELARAGVRADALELPAIDPRAAS